MPVDLDAARRARAEARGETPQITAAGRTFDLRSELPMDAVTAYRNAFRQDLEPGEDVEAARTFVRLVLADEADFDALWNVGLSFADLTSLLRAVLGTDAEGESAASSRTSNGGKRSRPTSKTSTK